MISILVGVPCHGPWPWRVWHVVFLQDRYLFSDSRSWLQSTCKLGTLDLVALWYVNDLGTLWKMTKALQRTSTTFRSFLQGISLTQCSLHMSQEILGCFFLLPLLAFVAFLPSTHTNSSLRNPSRSGRARGGFRGGLHATVRGPEVLCKAVPFLGIFTKLGLLG